MATKCIWMLMSVIAMNLFWEQRPLRAQEKRPVYTLPQRFKADATGETKSSLSSNKAPAIDKTLESSAGIASEKARLTGVRVVSSNNYTRVMLDMSQQVRYETHRLPGDPVKGLPPRIYIDVFGGKLGMDGKEAIKVEDGLLRQIRVGQFSPDVVRVVLEMTSVRDHNVFELVEPYRVVIDVQGQKSSETLASVDRSKSAAAPASQGQKKNEVLASVEPSKPIMPPLSVEQSKPSTSPVVTERNKPITPVAKEAQPLPVGIKKIVLDPGHGGKDPGAIGVDGVAEKDIVLKVAKKLAAKLRKDLGVQVVLTRKDDRFVSLEDRTGLANAEDADLFISLHMNASSSGEARGVETYYLDNTTDEASMRLAARENSTSPRNVSDLQFILSDMTQNMKLEDSVTLAHRLHDSLVGSMSQRLGEVKDLGVKKALFYVLVGARMPSVLLEMFFITNKSEGRAMRQEDYQDSVVEALFDGIQKYNQSTLAVKTL
jgi:N-acetylmuramoyl-L-alanine amidase